MHFLHIAFGWQFAFPEYIAKMPGYDRLVPPKQLGHLCLRKPYGLLFKLNIQFHAAISAPIQSDICLFHLSLFLSLRSD
jgi:hypothetical protein